MPRGNTNNQQITSVSSNNTTGGNSSWMSETVKAVKSLPANPQQLQETKLEQLEEDYPSISTLPQKDAEKIRKSLQKHYGVSKNYLSKSFEAANELRVAIKYYDNTANAELIPNFLSNYKESFFSGEVKNLVPKVVSALENPTEKYSETGQESLTVEMQLIKTLFISQYTFLPTYLSDVYNDQLQQDYTAVVLDSLIKINQILDYSSELILGAFVEFVEKNDSLRVACEQEFKKSFGKSFEEFMESDESIDTKITKILPFITEEFTELVPFMYQELGIQDPTAVDDESTEPHGFWPKMIHMVFHPSEFVEFVKVKIWGKAPVDAFRDDDRDEMEGNGSAKDFAEGHSSYFTYVKDTVFSIINLSWRFSSHGGGANKCTDSTQKDSNLVGESDGEEAQE